MQRIKIMTDSASDLPAQTAEQLGIEIIPIPIAVDGKGYLEGVDFTPRQFYSILESAKEIPTTSQISPITYCERYYEAYQRGYTDIILVGISSSASATYYRSLDAVDLLHENCPETKDKLNIHIVDSKTFSLGYGYPVMQAAKMAQQGKSVEEILHFIHDWLERLEIYFTAFSFEFIKKSGRIGCASAIVGEALGIRPLIQTKQGEMKIVAKPRGNHAVMQKMSQILAANIDPQSPYLMLTGTQAGAQEDLTDMIYAATKKKPEFISDVGCAVSINSGPKMIGIGFLGAKKR